MFKFTVHELSPFQLIFERQQLYVGLAKVYDINSELVPNAVESFVEV